MLIEYWEGILNDAERDLNPHEIKTFVKLEYSTFFFL